MKSSIEIFRQTIERERHLRFHEFLLRNHEREASQALQLLREGYAKAQRESHLDTDRDGITDKQEYAYGTSSHSLDTDWDGRTDLEEISSGHNPRIPCPKEKLKTRQVHDEELEF